MKAGEFAATAAFGLALLASCISCRSAREIERADASRLRAFLVQSHTDYLRALQLDSEVIEAITATAERVTAESAELQCERLRRQVLNPKHTFKYLHDRLNAMRLSGQAESWRRRAVGHFKSRERALLRFTTLLAAIRDKAADRKSNVLPSEVSELSVAADQHPAAADEITAILLELDAFSRS